MRTKQLFAFIFLSCLAIFAKSSHLQDDVGFDFEVGLANMNPADGWNSGKLGYMATGSGGRKSETQVKFEKEFNSVPDVSHGIIYLDSEHKVNKRINTFISNVTTKGFTVTFTTWADTKIYGCAISWNAHPKSEDTDKWDNEDLGI